MVKANVLEGKPTFRVGWGEGEVTRTFKIGTKLLLEDGQVDKVGVGQSKCKGRG